MGSRDSFGALVGDLVESFPADVNERTAISDFGKLLFSESQSTTEKKEKPAEPAVFSSTTGKRSRPPNIAAGFAAELAAKNEIKGVPRQKTFYDSAGNFKDESLKKMLKVRGKAAPKRWSSSEDEALRQAVKRHGERNWKAIADEVDGRNHTQCLQRWTKVLAPGLVKGHWRSDEDQLLKSLVAEGRKNWGQVASRIPGRTSKQCRERWYNHLDPNIVRGDYTADEDRIILESQARLGNRWSAISAMLPGRTEDAVKIRWKSLCRAKSGRKKNNAAAVEKLKQAESEKAQQQQQQQQHTSQVEQLMEMQRQQAINQQLMMQQQQQHQMMVKQDVNDLLKMDDTPQPYVYMNQQSQFNPAAAFVQHLNAQPVASPMAQQPLDPNLLFLHQQQRQQQMLLEQRQMQMYQMHHVQNSMLAKAKSSQTLETVDEKSPSEDTESLKTRPSVDAAARASAARRNRSSESGSRSSIDGFLTDLGDVGRISDIDLSDLASGSTGIDEVWRMSGDLNRLSL